MMKKLNWEGYSSGDRNKVIEEVKDVISKSDGCIMNFSMFSDLAISLSIEIEESGIVALHKTLSNVLTISELSAENINANSSKDWLIFMNLSFTKGTGEMTVEIPEVPG